MVRAKRKSSIKVGVIGTGFANIVQLPVFQEHPDIEVVAVCSARPERAQETAQRFGIPHAFTDYQAVLQLRDLDAVSVVTPPYLHHPMVMAALEAGKHVLCEKPFAMSAAEAREMLDKARGKGLAHMVNHEFRFIAARVRMRELIQEGFLGRLHTVCCALYHGGAADPVAGRPWGWISEASKGGGWFGALGSHYIDAVRFLFGEITAVAGSLHTAVERRHLPDSPEARAVDADDSFSFTFRLDGGAMGTLSGSNALCFGSGFRIEAYGRQGTLKIHSGVINYEPVLQGAQVGEPDLKELEIPKHLMPYPHGEDVRMLPQRMLADRFVAGIRGEEQPAPSFYDGLRCQQVMDAVRRSGREGRWVEIPEEE